MIGGGVVPVDVNKIITFLQEYKDQQVKIDKQRNTVQFEGRPLIPFCPPQSVIPPSVPVIMTKIPTELPKELYDSIQQKITNFLKKCIPTDKNGICLDFDLIAGDTNITIKKTLDVDKLQMYNITGLFPLESFIEKALNEITGGKIFKVIMNPNTAAKKREGFFINNNQIWKSEMGDPAKILGNGDGLAERDGTILAYDSNKMDKIQKILVIHGGSSGPKSIKDLSASCSLKPILKDSLQQDPEVLHDTGCFYQESNKITNQLFYYEQVKKTKEIKACYFSLPTAITIKPLASDPEPLYDTMI